MCVGRCSRFVGLSLTSLAMVSITANALLLFPNWSWRYLTRGLITTQALLLPGIWGGGLMVLLAATQITAAGSKAHGLRCCGPRWNMFLSMLFSGLALLGSAISFGIASAGLVMGPYCLHYDPLSNQTQTLTWGSPFSDREKMSLLSSAPHYLMDHRLWDSTCLEPLHIVPWNVGFFGILCLAGALQSLLSAVQIINGLFGCFCGVWDHKQSPPQHETPPCSCDTHKRTTCLQTIP
ncbi:transmembrane 4 L6 family member 19 isoform X1 [Ambystoma mexicanum]|uniref:transmembrane 4 L6 family member 19 isoform X1 n=1 Tax=Ambystoma mexicanum TaxID=8296 RepID=UPI0037E960B3